MRLAAPARDPFLERATGRLRLEAPSSAQHRSDLNGDHALDPAGRSIVPPGPPRHAAVLVPVVMHPRAPSVLLTERASGLRNHSGQIAFPGGRMDSEDSSPLETALREAEEEVGLDRLTVRPLGYLDAYLSSSNYFVLPVVAAVAPAPSLRLNPEEVAGTFEVPLAFLMDEDNHELHARPWNGGIRQYYAMPFEDKYIWGLTAAILRNMHEKLFAA